MKIVDDLGFISIDLNEQKFKSDGNKNEKFNLNLVLAASLQVVVCLIIVILRKMNQNNHDEVENDEHSIENDL